jgi:hypothetical protein
MTEPMLVTRPNLINSGDTTEISVIVDDFQLWYSVPETWPVVLHGDPFAIAGLLPAMATGRDLHLPDELPISIGVLERLERLQQIFLAWGPALGTKFSRVQVRATVGAAPPAVPGLGSYFSGGVDGTYTFLKHRPNVAHAIFLKGIDMQVTNDGLYQEALQANREFVEARGAAVISAATNVRFFGHHFGLSWNTYLGAGLASMASAIRLEQVLLAAGHTWGEMRPNGTHPLTDPLWSGGSTTIIRDGEEARRSQKLAAIAVDPGALAILRVCWQDNGYNCGTCEKCLRTMAAIELLGLTASRFPRFPGIEVLEKQRITDEGGYEFMLDLHDLALERKRHDFAAALFRPIRRYQQRRALRDFDRDVLGGRMRRILHSR